MFLAVALATAAAACGSFGSNDAPPAPAPDGGTMDGGADRGGGDAAVADVAPGSSFCAMHPAAIFCDDFEAELSTAKWPTTPAVGGGAVDRVLRARPGEPGNMVLHTRTVSSDAKEALAALYHPIAPGHHHVVYSFDLYIAALSAVDTAAYPRPRVSWWESATAHTWVNIEGAPPPDTKVSLIAWGNGAQPQSVTGAAPFLREAWHHVRVELDGTDSRNPTFNVTWEGVPVMQPLPTAFVGVEAQTLVLGTSTTFAGTVDLFYDNVLIETLE